MQERTTEASRIPTIPRTHEGMAFRLHARKVHLPPLLLCILMLATLEATGPVEAGCAQGAVNCANNTAAMQRTCTAQLMCSSPPVGTFWAVTDIYPHMNVTQCSPTSSSIFNATATFTLSARAMTSSPTSRSCSWRWRSSSGMRLLGGSSGTVTITTADGLPVELMDFSIDGGESASSTAEPEISAAPD